MGNINNVDNAKHKRYFVYRHQLDSDVIEYHDDVIGLWSTNFSRAGLNDNIQSTRLWLHQTKDRTKYNDPDTKFIFCIGEVEIAVNPFFDPVVI